MIKIEMVLSHIVRKGGVRSGSIYTGSDQLQSADTNAQLGVPHQSSSRLEIAKENDLQWENMAVPGGSMVGAGGDAGNPPSVGTAWGNGNGIVKVTCDNDVTRKVNKCFQRVSQSGAQFAADKD